MDGEGVYLFIYLLQLQFTLKAAEGPDKQPL